MTIASAGPGGTKPLGPVAFPASLRPLQAPPNPATPIPAESAGAPGPAAYTGLQAPPRPAPAPAASSGRP